ncbi:MAG: CoA transferase [Gammaproteobacteria bacterium]|nr:CoA transferase [Gammaproteobacteria bacterium]
MTNDLENNEKVDKKTNGLLSGIRVLDLSRILAGPYCTQLLGDYGADVIKVERPGVGDDTRSWGPPYLGTKRGKSRIGSSTESAYYLSANRNKRSVALDMSTEEGASIIQELSRHCDVVVENFKVGGLKKYGLDYETLSNAHPELIYCSISGFGQSGPNAHRPGYDLLAQAFGGIMSLTGEPQGEPMKVGVGIADVMCGMYATTAILAALRHRDKTGEGQHIDIALADTQVAWLINGATNYLVSGNEPQRLGNQHPNIVPYQVFATRDGHVVVAVGNDVQFSRFCSIIGVDELATDPRYQTNAGRLENRDALIETLGEVIQSMDKERLISAMEENGVPGGPINTLPEVFASEQVAAREMKITMSHDGAEEGEVDLIGNPVKFSKTPVTYRQAPPMCGEHTEEVLKEILNK